MINVHGGSRIHVGSSWLMRMLIVEAAIAHCPLSSCLPTEYPLLFTS
ncbi:MAG: hypothetical protein MUF49_16360 [Oculatellaceae cyanobacterium Prado106]|nr:hypothetical protein [Oculatellaceae cyanobacterium Prado106]